jgi:hypothetical protein
MYKIEQHAQIRDSVSKSIDKYPTACGGDSLLGQFCVCCHFMELFGYFRQSLMNLHPTIVLRLSWPYVL